MASDQALIFGRYLLKQTPNADVQSLYDRAMAADAGKADAQDTTLLTFITRHPWSLGAIDGALALIKPNSEVRRRLYVMFSILEAAPEYHRHFLPQKHSWWYLFVIGATGVRAVARALCGIVLVKVVAK